MRRVMRVSACLARPVQPEGVVSLVSRVHLVVQVILAETENMARMVLLAKLVNLVSMAKMALMAGVDHPARWEIKATLVMKLRTSCRPISMPSKVTST